MATEFPSREVQSYDADVVAAVGTDRPEYVKAYALAYADWLAGFRTTRPAPKRYRMTGSNHWVERLVSAL